MSEKNWHPVTIRFKHKSNAAAILSEFANELGLVPGKLQTVRETNVRDGFGIFVQLLVYHDSPDKVRLARIAALARGTGSTRKEAWG